MSQQEFDTYLSLLCRLLRIAPQQREQVAEEFRAHLEDRLEELLSRGMPREEAIKLALEEFGDAAGLAAQLVSIVQGRRKRWIMRIGTVSVVGLAAAVLLGVAFWPEGGKVKVLQAVAQTEEKPAAPGGGPAGGGGVPAKPEAKAEQSIEQKLAQRIDADYPEVPFKELLEDLQQRTQIQIYVNRKAISGTDISLDAPISINLKSVRVDTVLDLVLEQAGDQELAYVERDGILIISTADALSGASEVKVYNCRDLLAMASPVPSGGMPHIPAGLMPGGGGGHGLPGLPGLPTGGGALPRHPNAPDDSDLPRAAPPGSGGSPSSPPKTNNKGGGFFNVEDAGQGIPKGIQPQFGGGGGGGIVIGGPGAAGGMAAGGGGMGGGGMGGMAGGSEPSTPRTEEEIRAERLMHLITTAVKPDSWQDMGGFGTISEYKGLIVINHNARTHKEVENVLKMLREAAGLPESGPVGGMMMPMPGAMPGGGPIPGAAPRLPEAGPRR
ncbi:MAG: STN domain-containing protein [Planctomycetales bacterium]|nr:STN domain-containing protein [Planctomycetales bacterium]